MALTPGTRLGSSEVVAQIGVGGMGEVYKATDTLKRAVAIKVLPTAVAADADRLARFQREAEVLAALNHPNIAAIYGLERSGAMTALVMELVGGPTLADRIARGAIPIDEALPIAKQIAEALEAAHEQGIIHRDLKPTNIKVRPDGTVKVLDFGLAKALDPPAGTEAAAALTNSPTVTSPTIADWIADLHARRDLSVRLPGRGGRYMLRVGRHHSTGSEQTKAEPSRQVEEQSCPTIWKHCLSKRQ